MRIQNVNVRDRHQAVMIANCMEDAGADVFSIMESHSEGYWIVWCKVKDESVADRYNDCFFKKWQAFEKQERAEKRKAARKDES